MLEELLTNKALNAKEQTAALAQLILSGDISVEEVTGYAAGAKDPAKGNCIEAMEYASQQRPELVTEAAIRFVIDSLAAKAPRVRWEAAKVIANTIYLHARHTGDAVNGLLANTTHSGTVVRWSAATALASIVKLKTSMNETLVPALQAIMDAEEKNSIKKIYMAALKQAAK